MLRVIVEENVKFPPYSSTDLLEVAVNEPIKPVQFKLKILRVNAGLVLSIVQVMAPEFASKNTSSNSVGTDAPPAPPDVADHFVPAVLSYVSVPPTQYLLAMISPV